MFLVYREMARGLEPGRIGMVRRLHGDNTQALRRAGIFVDCASLLSLTAMAAEC
jgi:hypothetical protein